MRIAYVSPTLGLGGLEQLIVELTRQMTARGHQVLAVSMGSDTPHAETLVALGAQVVSMNLPRRCLDPRAPLRLARLLQQHAIDVVHSHGYPANMLARLSRLFYRTRTLVCTAHAFQERGPGARWLYPLTDPLCDLTTNVSRAAVAQYIRLKRVPAHRIRYMPNGIMTDRMALPAPVRVEMRRALGIAETTFAWLSIGRFIPEKDYPTLIEAFGRVHANAGGALYIVGYGELEPALTAQIAASPAAGAIHLLGKRTDIPEVLQAADAYVLSSYSEGMPIVLLEAAAAGLPIVATDVSGCRDIVAEGRTGLIVPASDAGALADAMLALQRMPPADRQAMGSAGRRIVQDDYDIRVLADQWERIYLDPASMRDAVEIG